MDGTQSGNGEGGGKVLPFIDQQRQKWLETLKPADRKKFLKLEGDKKEEFIADSRRLHEVEKKLSEIRGRMNPKVTQATKTFHESVEAPHNGTAHGKAKAHDNVVALYKAKLALEEERSGLIDPLIAKKSELEKRIRGTWETMDQLRLDFGKHDEPQ